MNSKMAALFAKLISSSTFVGAGPSHTCAAAWCRFLGLVQREFLPGSSLSRNRLEVSPSRASLNHPFLKLPPINTSSGDTARQQHSLPRASTSPKGPSLIGKEFLQVGSYQALVLDLTQVELRRSTKSNVQALAYNQALWFRSTAKRQFSTTPTGSEGTGAPKKLCSVCNHEKPFRNFAATRSSVDGLHSLCRACLATLRAKRNGRPLFHLSLSVEEAWERARVCKSFGQLQEVREFPRLQRQPDGVHLKCRSCNSGYQKTRLERLPSTEPQECSICGIQKPAAEYYAMKKGVMGLHRYCKSCHIKRSKGWVRKVRESTLCFPTARKRCLKCGKEKSRFDFWKKRLSTDGLDTHCKECSKRTRSK